ncbi:MAG TPA: 5-(carboxyamino)imidazole ribonucleotide mutase [Candidatus Thermoplasmatota archaeon]|nr:5-(carboxyamino)imidazole ribonucleotide mutase [Candidatus Thermoplasmatota archaeon]
MPEVHVLLGSKSDAPVAEALASVLKELGVSYKIQVASAHRTPERVAEIVRASDAKVFVGIAGVSCALPGAIAALTVRPVIGVPVSGKVNLDAILSAVQMPPGVPVAAVGLDRGENAGILAAQILAVANPALQKRLEERRVAAAKKVVADSADVERL